MAADRVPGVSVAVIRRGAIDWARGFGVTGVGGMPVTTETLFQAGSISKPVAAMAALRLVQEGRLSLDTDVNSGLVTWTVPPSDAAPGAVVTLRQLLSHTAGFNVGGFPGYSAGAAVPSLMQVLNGEPPANTAPVRVESVPGTKWSYSGGGYTVMQQLMQDVSHRDFPGLLRDSVLAPIGMTRSAYEQPLPEGLRPRAAVAHRRGGVPVEGGFHTYPELAAAGLWTTPSDIARFAIEIHRSLRGEPGRVLSIGLARQMLVPGLGHFGLGLSIGGSAATPYFSHGGVNDGFENMLVAYGVAGDGAVVMTNATGGTALANAVIRSVATVYGWPDLQPVVRTRVAVDAAALARHVGVYRLSQGVSMTVSLEEGQLMGRTEGLGLFQLFPQASGRFFLKVVDAELEFTELVDGRSGAFVLHQPGEESRWVRAE